MLRSWQFRKFSEGRFVAVGQCSRRLCLSIMLGLPQLVGHVLQYGGSAYYIGGFKRHLAPE
eukprot:15101708-Alexandrium_andersonii.AAC.1